jgi:hypothetical protein
MQTLELLNHLRTKLFIRSYRNSRMKPIAFKNLNMYFAGSHVVILWCKSIIFGQNVRAR